MDLRVRDRKTGAIRTVTHKAYAAMGPKVYEKLGPEETAPAQVHRTISAPVVRPQIPEPVKEAEQPNKDAESAPKRRPGRPAADKSISSNPTDDEK